MFFRQSTFCYYSILVYLLFPIPVYATSTENSAFTLLDNLFTHQPLQVSFMLSRQTEEKIEEEEILMHGVLTLSQEKYRIKLVEKEVWCDGVHIWTYYPGVKEVEIENCDAMMSLPSLLAVYKQDYRPVSVIKKKNATSKKIEDIIELHRKDEKTEISWLKIHFDQVSGMPTYLEAKIETDLLKLFIKQAKGDVSLQEDYFTFDPKKYPDIEIVDLQE